MQNKLNSGKLWFIFGSLLVGLIIFVSFKIYGYENTWKFWQIETLMPPFADLRLIPGAAETFHRGLDPTVENPGDPYGRIFNYPRIWYLFFYTGIDQDDVIWLGILIFALFYIGLISFPERLNRLGVILMLLITFSPAAMLLYERNNVDLLIFFICALAILILNRSVLGTVAIILFGTILKIFPVFGMGILLEKSWKQFWRSMVFVIASFGIYTWLTFSNIRASWNLTMRGKTLSYGVNILFDRYNEYFMTIFQKLPPPIVAKNFLGIFPYLLGLAIFVIILVLGLKASSMEHAENSRNLAAFRMGAFIYIGTFLLGNNWDYRLAFLLFTLPQLADWVYSTNGRQRTMVFITIGLIVISCWHFILAHWFSLIFINPEIAIILDEIANWGLFAMLVYLSVISLPDWAKGILRNPVRGVLMVDQYDEIG